MPLPIRQNGVNIRLLPTGQQMRISNQLVAEVHYFPIPADELAERGCTLRNLLLRGARRSIEQHRDCNRDVGTPEENGVLTLDGVEK
jgi:hypothetical protein